MSGKAWAAIIIFILILIYDPNIINQIVNALIALLNHHPTGG